MAQIRSQPNTYGYCFNSSRSLYEAPPSPIVGHIDKTVDKIGIHTERNNIDSRVFKAMVQ